MKIVNVILTSQNGGAEQVFVDYLVTLKKLGHDVIAVVKKDAPYAKKIEDLGIEVHKITNHFGYHDVVAVRKMTKILKECDADVTLSHMGRAVSLVRKSIRNINSKKILEVAVNHSMNVKRSIGADVILSVNKEVFFRTIDAGQSDNASFVVSNAIDVSDGVQEIPHLALEKKAKITIGSMGRLDQPKGFHHAIKALKELDEKFVLKIAGTGEYEADLRDLTAQLGLENRVEFCGWVGDKKSFFESIDLFCLSSENETFGLVLLEAMKYCKPIIATQTDGVREILKNKEEALFVDLGSSQIITAGIVEAVRELVSDDEAASVMVENAALKVKNRFSYQALEQVMEEIFGAA